MPWNPDLTGEFRNQKNLRLSTRKRLNDKLNSEGCPVWRVTPLPSMTIRGADWGADGSRAKHVTALWPVWGVLAWALGRSSLQNSEEQNNSSCPGSIAWRIWKTGKDRGENEESSWERLYTEIGCIRVFLTSLHIEQMHIMIYLPEALFPKSSRAENSQFPGRGGVKPAGSSSCWAPRGKREWGDFWAELLSESPEDAAWCCGCDGQCQWLTQQRAERKPELQADMISVSHQISSECTEWLTRIKYLARKLPVLQSYLLIDCKLLKAC